MGTFAIISSTREDNGLLGFPRANTDTANSHGITPLSQIGKSHGDSDVHTSRPPYTALCSRIFFDVRDVRIPIESGFTLVTVQRHQRYSKPGQGHAALLPDCFSKNACASRPTRYNWLFSKLAFFIKIGREKRPSSPSQARPYLRDVQSPLYGYCHGFQVKIGLGIPFRESTIGIIMNFNEFYWKVKLFELCFNGINHMTSCTIARVHNQFEWANFCRIDIRH